MDFVVGLPKTRANHDAIWVIVDRLTESAHFIPINERFSLDKLVHLYQKEIVLRHGVPVQLYPTEIPDSTQDSGDNSKNAWELSYI